MAVTVIGGKKTKKTSESRIPLTREERRAKVIKKITSSKEEAKKFLIGAGILGEDGKLTKIYR